MPTPIKTQERATVTLPEGASLRRVAEVLLDAWETGSHQWRGTPLQLRDGPGAAPSAPVPQDAMELFRLLHERQVKYLLVASLAMLTYVQGRNTKDVDLLMSVTAMERIPELTIEDREGFFAGGKFRSIAVDLLLTSNPLFKIIEDRYATVHHFAELDVPAATADGLIALKLYALPSLYRQMNLDRAAIFETDITMLLARREEPADALLALVSLYIEPGDKAELKKVLAECEERTNRLRRRTHL